MGLGLSWKIKELLPRSFQNIMARYSSNFGGKLQIKVYVGKECGFTSIFGIPMPFVRRKTALARKKARAKS